MHAWLHLYNTDLDSLGVTYSKYYAGPELEDYTSFITSQVAALFRINIYTSFVRVIMNSADSVQLCSIA